MGEALATRLVAKNWNVALFDVSEKAGSKLGMTTLDSPLSHLPSTYTISAGQLGKNAAFFKSDVASYDSQAHAFKSVWSRWGRIDALLANAGIVDRSSVYILKHRGAAVNDVPPAPNMACTDVDYKGVVYGTVLATHFMRHNPTPGGKIIATASAAGIIPHPTYAEYNGAKAAVITFARGVADVLYNKDKIAFNVVCPGIVATSIIPPEMIAAVSPECLTPVDTIVRAYEEFLDEEEGMGEVRHGQVVEGSADKIITLKMPELGNGRVSQRAVTVWDPLFEMMHGEKSGLPDAIP